MAFVCFFNCIYVFIPYKEEGSQLRLLGNSGVDSFNTAHGYSRGRSVNKKAGARWNYAQLGKLFSTDYP